MKYLKGTIFTTKYGLDILSAILMDLGLLALEINDPDDLAELLSKEGTYEWDYISQDVLDEKTCDPSIVFYLEEGEEARALSEKIAKRLCELKAESESERLEERSLGSLEFVCEVLDDEAWKDKWKEYFKPAHITEDIVVKPTWEQYTKKEGEKVIEIDPGAAFGTGTHPTTVGCVVLMQKYMKPSSKVLDVGCGSGILSIAAGLLGASDVLGIEIDPVAIEVGRQNVNLNGFSDRVRVEYGDLTKGISYKADIVVANLMADLVKMLTKDVKRHLNEGGIYICSGILLELCEEVSEVIEGFGFEIIDVYRDERDGGWCAIAATY